MKKKLLIGALAVAFVVAATTVVLATMIEDPENPGTWHVVIDDLPGGGGSCNCPMVFAPVLCDKNGETKAYSNACVAGCHNATNCRQVVWN
jgi:hypothetical protein